MTNHQQTYESPLGPITITATRRGISSLYFKPPEQADCPNEHTSMCAQQLDAYFQGQQTSFDVPLDVNGTAFQKQVWQALQDIPYGQVASYRDIAIAIGNPKAMRAVGAANGKNPVSIVVPCHRVIGADGSLTGYAGGLSRKQHLLQLEAKAMFNHHH
ncbi:methylated-DNA--[protein]-cysteine S-methyltransferase [Marinicella sediminis]|uniref:Methylated-DNA--protein-cysteine methyltransferase n=1 Tax=Marinicella sediminis TaxID=1792834 RepID=A0ABV7J8S0_9GAMM|nr:methylated-DNA--[protein]-cysteine S-methyltransferase [Marinicella sediminis]